MQESIFAADGNHDYKTECAKSGEPLIKTMVPSHEEDVASGYEAPVSLVKTFLGDPPEHINAYDVCILYLSFVFLLFDVLHDSFLSSTKRSANCANHIWIIGRRQPTGQKQVVLLTQLYHLLWLIQLYLMDSIRVY